MNTHLMKIKNTFIQVYLFLGGGREEWDCPFSKIWPLTVFWLLSGDSSTCVLPLEQYDYIFALPTAFTSFVISSQSCCFFLLVILFVNFD